MKRINKLIADVYSVDDISQLKEIEFSWDELKDIKIKGINLKDGDECTDLLDDFLNAFSMQQQLESITLKDNKLYLDLGVLFKPRDWSYLKQFKLVSSDDASLSAKDVMLIGQFIRSMKQVEQLQLSFNKTNFSHESLLEQSKSLLQLNQLETLILSYRYCSNINDSVIQSLCKSLISLNRLKSLQINLEKGSITNLGLGLLGETISKINNLKSLHLNVSRNESITIIGSQNYFNSILKHPNHAKFQTEFYSAHEDAKLSPHYQSVINYQSLTNTCHKNFSSQSSYKSSILSFPVALNHKNNNNNKIFKLLMRGIKLLK